MARTLVGGSAFTVVTALLLVACGGGNNGGGGGTNPSPPPPSLAGLTVNPPSVVGGTAAQGTVTLSAASGSGATVSLSSNNAAATVPATVAVAANATTATFNVGTTAVNTATPVTITGTFNGSQSATLMLTPAAPPPVPFVASMTIKSLTAALRQTNNGKVPVPGKGAGSVDTCPLVPDNNNTPQLSCLFDGSASTSPNGIKGYRWSWKVGSAQADGQTNAEPTFQPKVSNCGFFAGQSSGSTQQLQMVVTLTITDNSNNTTSVMNQNVAVFPAGLCGYDF